MVLVVGATDPAALVWASSLMPLPLLLPMPLPWFGVSVPALPALAVAAAALLDSALLSYKDVQSSEQTRKLRSLHDCSDDPITVKQSRAEQVLRGQNPVVVIAVVVVEVVVVLVVVTRQPHQPRPKQRISSDTSMGPRLRAMNG